MTGVILRNKIIDSTEETETRYFVSSANCNFRYLTRKHIATQQDAKRAVENEYWAYFVKASPEHYTRNVKLTKKYLHKHIQSQRGGRRQPG